MLSNVQTYQTAGTSDTPVVARKEEAWKAVKDVLRDVIDGQPKRGDFWDDYNNDNRRVYSGYVQTKDDALQAYGIKVKSSQSRLD